MIISYLIRFYLKKELGNKTKNTSKFCAKLFRIFFAMVRYWNNFGIGTKCFFIFLLLGIFLPIEKIISIGRNWKKNYISKLVKIVGNFNVKGFVMELSPVV